jgi:iron complex outermembrane receptor protein
MFMGGTMQIRNTALPSAVCVISLLAMDAHAQTTETTNSSTGLEEVMVTARRKSERIEEVPVAITAVTGDMIENRNLRTLADIQALTPSLTLTTTNSKGAQSSIGLRGQRQSGSGIQVDPSVGTYFNDVYLARASIDTSLYDLESVQVVKGPQGTLFGRNTTGGAVLVNSRRPTPDFGGYVRAQAEDPEGHTLEGAINVPVGAEGGLRLSGIRQYAKGYTDVLGASYKLDDRDRFGLRTSLALNADKANTLFVVDYFKYQENGVASFPYIRNSALPAAGASTAPVYAAFDQQRALQAPLDRTVGTTAKPYSRGKIWGISNTSTFDVTDNITLKNIAAYRHGRSSDLNDFDGTTAPVLWTEVYTKQDQVSEEFQVQGKSFGEALDWIAGLYYFTEEGYDHGGSALFASPTATLARSQNWFSAVNESQSAFAHAAYKLPMSLTAHIFGGVRVTEDKRQMSFESHAVSATGNRTCNVVGAPATLFGYAVGPCALKKEKTFNSTTWDVGADVEWVDGLLNYVTVSRGFRTGGFNGRATNLTSQQPYEPENVTNYEVGLKYSGSLGSMRTIANLAVYHSEYDDIQANLIVAAPNGAPVSTIINAAKGKIDGLELELTVYPIDKLGIGLFYSYLDASYSEFEQLGQDISNNKFAGVPKHQGGASVDWSIVDLGNSGLLNLNVAYRYSGEFQNEPINFPGNVNPAFSVVDASLQLRQAFGTGMTLEIYGKNLADEDYQTGGFSVASSLGFASSTRGTPRIVGVGVRMPFGSER